MLSSKLLKQIMSEARPIIERQLDDSELIAGLRDVFAAEGGDWGALKALIKSQVQDERDEVGDGKRIRKLRDRSGNQLAYADMLGLGEMNEQNYSEDDDREADVVVSDTIDSDVNRLRVSVDPRIAAILARTESTTPNTSVPEGFDPETGEEVTTPEITEPQPETAVQMRKVEAVHADDQLLTSLAGAEGIADQHSIIEQQPAPAARDLTAPQALNGQVATPLQKDAGETIPSDHPGARPEASPEISGKPEATHTLGTANEADGDVLGHAVQPVAADHSIPAVIAETTEGGPHESAAHPEPVIDPGRRHDDLKSHSAGGQTNEAVNTSAHIAAGEGAPIASAASNITQLRVPKPLRPNCLKPEMCGGQGRQHCWSCEKAMTQRAAQ